MLKIEKPDRLNSSMKALTAGVDFELVYQRENPNEYLFRILRDGVLDAKMAISKDWNKGDTVIIRFADKDNHWVMATYELDFDVVRNRSQFIFWISERFLEGYIIILRLIILQRFQLSDCMVLLWGLVRFFTDFYMKGMILKIGEVI